MYRRPIATRDRYESLEIIRAIQRRGHHVTFIPDNLYPTVPYTEDLQRMGVEVIHVPYFSSVRGYLELHGNEFNLVMIARAEIASRHFKAVKRYAPRATLVFDTVDLHFLREEREAEVKGDPGS